ncbi:MAG: hypothetical protein V4454_14195 [Pseudomonadota bacterium]
MKHFLPFLLIPFLAAAGWGLASYSPEREEASFPQIAEIEEPPLLGQPPARPQTDGPVRVRMTALLPPATVAANPENPSLRQPEPRVSAILVDGSRRVAQIDGIALAVGESRGVYRVAVIESERVLFVQTVLGTKRWIQVNPQ